jgi:hypothetical protein
MSRWSGHSTIDAEVETANTQLHAAMTQTRTFWRNPEKFALLTLYEQRISRKVLKNEDRLRAIQADRKSHEVTQPTKNKPQKPQMASVFQLPNPTPTNPPKPTNSASKTNRSGTPQ